MIISAPAQDQVQDRATPITPFRQENALSTTAVTTAVPLQAPHMAEAHLPAAAQARARVTPATGHPAHPQAFPPQHQARSTAAAATARSTMVPATIPTGTTHIPVAATSHTPEAGVHTRAEDHPTPAAIP